QKRGGGGGGANAEDQRHREVAELVDEHQEPEPDDGDEDRHAGCNLRDAMRRASSSLSTSSARSRAGAPSTAWSVSSTTSAISGKRRRPSRKASTATS